MTGKQRVLGVLSGSPVDRAPIMPIIHSALAAYAGVPLGKYFSDASAMADVVVEGHRRFGFDGVQLTLGVSAEPEALGARVERPPDGAPLLKEHLLAGMADPDSLRGRTVATGGRIPMYLEAVEEVAKRVGNDVFVLSTLRGPLNIASQLRGVEDTLIDMLRHPDKTQTLLAYTTEIAIEVSRASLNRGADGLIFGEATCSPNFISPDMYRSIVQPWHVRLVAALREMGWRYVGLHVCGRITPILEDLIATGVDLLDVDYQVPAEQAIALASGRVALRGNLNPTSTLLLGKPERIREETAAVCRAATGKRWIMSSGCDIPAGTPPENIETFVQTARTTCAG